MTLAIVFDSVGAGEWLVLLAVLLVVIGPKNLPSTLRKMGNYYAKFRRAADSFKRQLMDMDREFERSFEEPPAAAAYSQPEPEPEPMSEPPGDVFAAMAEAESEAEAMVENGVAPMQSATEGQDGDRPDQQA